MKTKGLRYGQTRGSASLFLGLLTLCCASLVAHNAFAQSKIHIKISASSTVAESFNHWTAMTPWAQITNFTGADAQRATVDLILELQALNAGGLNFDYELVVAPNYEIHGWPRGSGFFKCVLAQSFVGHFVAKTAALSCCTYVLLWPVCLYSLPMYTAFSL